MNGTGGPVYAAVNSPFGISDLGRMNYKEQTCSCAELKTETPERRMSKQVCVEQSQSGMAEDDGHICM